MDIRQHITGVKQSFLLRTQSISAFNSDLVKQSLKGGRYSNDELRETISTLRDSHQLPFTIDLVDHLEGTHWISDKWSKQDCDLKAIFLSVAIAFDTGRRISNLTHRDKKFDEDHCIRWGNVKICMAPCGTKMVAGQNFKAFYCLRKYELSNVESIQLHFVTQKQSMVNNIVAVQPVIIDRRSSRSSSLVDKVVQWTLFNTNDEHEEFLTRHVEESDKKLLRRNVIAAMKEAARVCGIDPSRISSHSIRRCYATNIALNDCSKGNAVTRAGWSSSSVVPTQNYAIPLNDHGGLSYPKLLHSGDLTSGHIGVVKVAEHVWGSQGK